MTEILNKPDQIDILATELETLVSDIGLQDRIVIDAVPTRAGVKQIRITGNREIRIAWGSGLEKLANGNNDIFINQMAAAIGRTERSVAAVDLLSKEEFRKACITEVEAPVSLQPNVILSSFLPNGNIPVFYGSTSGINASEVLETIACANVSEKRLGVPTSVIFDFSSPSNIKANEIFSRSITALTPSIRTDALEFVRKLGQNPQEQQLAAAQLIFNADSVTFVETGNIFQVLGANFSIGKLLVLAKLAGEDPFVFPNIRANELLKSTNQSQEGKALLRKSVAEIDITPAGFTYYTREATIGADTTGVFIQPLKLTDKANIYKIIGTYGGLVTQNPDRGAILCPITRQRIQTQSQIRSGSGDPIDIRVLAFLASRNPEGMTNLREDFDSACRVLTPVEAQEVGTRDNRISISQYFEGVV